MNNWIQHPYKKCLVCKRPLSDKAKLCVGIKCWEKKVRGCPEHGKVPFWWEDGKLFIKCESCAEENKDDGIKLVWESTKRTKYYKRNYQEKYYHLNKNHYKNYYLENKNRFLLKSQKQHQKSGKKRKTLNLFCEICFKQLNTTDKRRKTCSEKCSKILHKQKVDLRYQKIKKPRKNPNCKICHKAIQGSRWLTCSTSCSRLLVNQRAREYYYQGEIRTKTQNNKSGLIKAENK